MNVKLLTYTNEPEKIVAAAAKLCYAKSDIGTLMDNLTDDKICEFLDRLSNLGHSSPTEHASFTFGIEGVSRSFLAQISRHRLASLSVQSQRYVDMTNAGFVMPEEFADDEPASKTFEDAVGYALESYDGLRKYLTVRYIQSGMDAKSAEKKAQEDARYVLPEACCTKMIITMNARELNHFFNLRCCNRAQWEIRECAEQMLRLVYPIAPHLFKNAGPSCACGACSEGTMSCGKAAEMRQKYTEIKTLHSTEV
nr:MAG TPA: Thymidylate synthase complementing protein [Caudoviricetes sp.]